MKDYSWILKLNMLILGLILVILFMSKARHNSLGGFMGVLGIPTEPAQTEKASRP